MFSILIIGVGQLGSRHLQALSRSEYSLHIDVADPQQEALNRCKQRWQEMRPSRSEVTFLTEQPAGRDYDLAIVATTSMTRAEAIRQLLTYSSVRYLVLEKVLFPCPADYYEIGKLLAAQTVPAWVNCARRMHPVFQELRPLFQGPIRLRFAGGDWGLGCNSIHFADLAAWFSGQRQFSWDTSRLDTSLLPAKRAGIVEFSGELTGVGADGTQLSLVSIAGSSAPPIMDIQSADVRVLLDESHGQGILYQQKNKWQPEALTFRIPYQSELSHLFVKALLSSGECALPGYEDSALLHLGLIHAFLNYGLPLGMMPELCPIT